VADDRAAVVRAEGAADAPAATGRAAADAVRAAVVRAAVARPRRNRKITARSKSRASKFKE
jgi:hypothetical protein